MDENKFRDFISNFDEAFQEVAQEMAGFSFTKMNDSPVDKAIEENAARSDSSDNIDPEFLNDFILDTKEHIEKIEMDTLLLETEPENIVAINSLFREFHTIKGSAGFVEQQLIQNIAHQTETLLDDCRTGNVKVNKVVIDLILSSTDFIKKLCENVSLNQDKKFVNLIETHLKNLLAIKQKKTEVNEIIDSLRKQEYESKKSSSDSGYIRIPVKKVDNLVDMMGELIIIQSLVGQEMSRRFGADDRLVSNLNN